MILILSEKGDLSTNDIINWLCYFNYPFVRINKDEPDKVELFVESYPDSYDFYFKVGNKKFSLNQIQAYWYRRGGLPKCRISNEAIQQAFEKEIIKDIEKYLIFESYMLYDFLYYILEKVPVTLGSEKYSDVNKLIVLDYAKECGLNVPDYSISMSKDKLNLFRQNITGSLITKGIWEGLSVFVETSGYSTYTEMLTNNDLNDLPNHFYPSLFQKNIHKKYELRIFYLKGSFYSMAIFSQKNRQTQVDFRKYDDSKPNRNIPYQLPKDIEEKLHRLMNRLSLDTGSIDMIVDLENDFYFLEVNPVGQFGMTSLPCNYNLEKEIALILANKK